MGIGEYDFATQTEASHHWWRIDGGLRAMSARFRYLWPGELDLMAHMAGLLLVDRWADWDRSTFDGESRSHISVWQKPAPRPESRRRR
ncbi:MAG TPA: hypothetical protein VFA11_05530 [Acidimicrobiales bacterium]|nr:hypothetical protein [Acidimicrobiales bacterium]